MGTAGRDWPVLPGTGISRPPAAPSTPKVGSNWPLTHKPWGQKVLDSNPLPSPPLLAGDGGGSQNRSPDRPVPQFPVLEMGRESHHYHHQPQPLVAPGEPVEWTGHLLRVARPRALRGGVEFGVRGLAPAVATRLALRQNLKIASASQTEHAEGKPRPTHGKRRAFWDLESRPSPPRPPAGLLDGRGAGRALGAQLGRRDGAKLQTEVQARAARGGG